MNKNKRKKVLDTLEKAVEITAKKILDTPQKEETIHVSGKFSIIKATNGEYKILSDRILYDGITLFDTARVVLEQIQHKKTSRIPEILSLDASYSKHKEDLLYYRHHASIALDKKDVERYFILEDRMLISMDAVERIKRKIKSKKIST